MTPADHVVIVGASAAGLTAAETLRAEGYEGRLTIVGEEPHHPYDRPPLSKQVLSGAWEPARTALRDAAALAAVKADWCLNRRATGLDVAGRQLALDDGARLSFDALLIATGVVPRHLAGAAHGVSGVHVLRTLEDALALRAAFAAHSRIIIIGAGFLGTECAAVAREAGLHVVLAYPHEWPLQRQFGPDIGCLLAEVHGRHGVELRPRAQASELVTRNGAVRGVRFADGSVCLADLVLMAIGSTPATAWLAGSGLTLQDGIACDAYCCAAPGVYAAGDVARWHHPLFGLDLRLEHRMNATEQAITAARNILGFAEPFAPIPFMWSNQYDERLQAFGIFPAGCEIEIGEIGSDGRKRTATFKKQGRLVGVLGWNAAKEARQLRQQLMSTPVAAN